MMKWLFWNSIIFAVLFASTIYCVTSCVEYCFYFFILTVIYPVISDMSENTLAENLGGLFFFSIMILCAIL